MPLAPLRIAIVGSGTAGPAAGIFLARAGHEVTLFERAEENRAVGAGFLLQPTGLGVLAQLDLRDALLPEIAHIRRLHCRTHGGRTLLDLHYDELQPGLFGAGTHRPALLGLLLGAAERAGVALRWGTPVDRLVREADGRPRLLDAHGHQHGPFDLLLVCDGANSCLRAQCGLPQRATRYPWGALWFIGERTPEFAPDVLWQCVGTTRELNGYLPTGTRRDLLSLFWSVRMDEIDRWRATPLADWKRAVLRLTPRAESFLAQIESHTQLAVAAYADVVLPRWHGQRIALLGDAAHALSPQLGQGVNLALLDAATLAAALQEDPLEVALARYSERRRAHLRFYQFATRWTTPFFQSDWLPLGWLRDFGFPIANAIPWSRREMVATMAGLKTGPFRRLEPSV
ncbi:MAG: FAD-dependent monooxygenase [Verrucomicrobia bacterium]|nr:FAD-dependent monooxygenase [Verrucomicrobiota bacterium]